MKISPSIIGLFLLVVVLVATLFALPGPAEDGQNDPRAATSSTGLALINARVFDGQSVHDQATLLMRDGRIEELLVDGPVPEGFEVVDIEGGTLLPGLIDAHVHSFNSARQDALRFGVTTMLDMFRPPLDLEQVRSQRDALRPTDQADLFSAGFLATAEGGHGTQYGIDVPTLTSPDEADAWVEARLAEGSDYIKIVIENGSAWSGQLPTLERPIVEALVKAAHGRNALAVAHVSTQTDARMAVEAGVDGLVHLFADEPMDPEFAAHLAARQVFVIPTATVLAGAHGRSGKDWITAADDLPARLSSEQRQSLDQSFPGSGLRAERWPLVPASIRTMVNAGVELLAGSDAPNPATAFGASLLHEIKLLSDSGMGPLAALRAATSVPAARFGLEGRGCLRAGCRADVVWIAGNPLDNVDELRALRAVWKNGAAIAVDTEVSAPAAATSEALAVPLDMHSTGQWMASTDEFMGGQSTAEIELVEAGASVEVSGQLNPGFPFPYAGVMWIPGDEMMTAVNLSNAVTLSLRLEAEQGSYELMLFSGQETMAPPIRIDLTANADNRIVLSDYSSLDPSRLRGIGVYATGNAQSYRFTLRDAVLR